MITRSKILLVLALASTVASFINGTDRVGGGILLPLGVVLLMAAFINHLMGREVAHYDQEQRRHSRH